MDCNSIFGPVPSGRLGRSLGLDLLGRPLCNFDCLYCEVGKTRIHTLTRKPWVRAERILAELEAWLSLDLPRPEYITLGGKGEPCLNSDMGAIINGVHDLAPDIPVAVLTNGTLMGHSEVQEALEQAQVVLPSMDTLIEEEFLTLNRPCSGLNLDTIRTSLLEWGAGYSGTIYLEILLVAGINDTQANFEAMQSFCRELAPDRIDVVTMTRPGAFATARPVDQEILIKWRTDLAHAARLSKDSPHLRRPPKGDSSGDSSVHFSTSSTHPALAIMDDDHLSRAILKSVAIRPQTIPQIALAMGVQQEQVQRVVSHLATSHQLTQLPDAHTLFYTIPDEDRK